MKEKWLQIDRAGKIRLVILALISLWCAYCVIAYCHEIYNLGFNGTVIDTGNIGPINIDGSDFTVIFKLLGTGANTLVVLSVFGIYSVVIVILCLIPIFLFWLIAIRKLTTVSAQEAELAQYTIGLGGVISFLGGILITMFRSRFPAVWLSLIWILPSFLIVVIPLRKRIAFPSQNNMQTGGN